MKFDKRIDEILSEANKYGYVDEVAKDTMIKAKLGENEDIL